MGTLSAPAPREEHVNVNQHHCVNYAGILFTVSTKTAISTADVIYKTNGERHKPPKEPIHKTPKAMPSPMSRTKHNCKHDGTQSTVQTQNPFRKV